MTGIWTPPGVDRKHREETAEREARGAEGLKDEAWAWVEDFNRDLEAVMPGMRLKWCPDPAPLDAIAMGAKPGRWGILVPGMKGGPASVKPIVGPGDCFVDPSLNASAIFDGLREQDWGNPQVMRERERAKLEAEKVAERRKEQEREERDAEVLEMFKAVTRSQVSMNRDTPWAQNASGYKRTRGKKAN